jgi:CII-binding regulator of phage lambda lysogenization HflD
MTKRTTQLLLFILFATTSILTGCRDGDGVTTAGNQSIERRLDWLIGDLDKSRGELALLADKIQNARGDELKGLIERKKVIRNTLPALSAIELSKELAELDWLAAVRQAILVEPSPVSLLDAETLLAEVPPGLEDVAPNLAMEHAAQTIQLANQLASSSSSESDDLQVMLSLLEGLEPTEDASGKELEPLMQKLRDKWNSLTQQELADELTSEANLLQLQLDRILSIQDLSLRTKALAAISQTVDAIQVRIAVDNITGPETVFSELRSKIDTQLNESLRRFGGDQEVSLVDARMKYQAWALDQIQNMKPILQGDSIEKELYSLRDNAAGASAPVKVPMAQYDGVRKRFEEVLGKLSDDLQLTEEQQARIPEFVKKNWYDLVYQGKHDAAVRYLLPIDQGLLEPPVAKFFSEAFEATWTQIEDGNELQLSLARKTAEVRKRTLQSFVEDGK